MKVLVDTSVRSLALRRKEPSETVKKLADLVLSSMVAMIGPVRQKLLSGIPDMGTFEKLNAKLDNFDDFVITARNYETAAQFFNDCRKQDVQGSHTDFLICAVAHNNNLLIFTTAKDFDDYAKHLPLRLLKD